eukprot:6204927-Pleurochrysis_carterae.AAC.2
MGLWFPDFVQMRGVICFVCWCRCPRVVRWASSSGIVRMSGIVAHLASSLGGRRPLQRSASATLHHLRPKLRVLPGHEALGKSSRALVGRLACQLGLAFGNGELALVLSGEFVGRERRYSGAHVHLAANAKGCADFDRARLRVGSQEHVANGSVKVHIYDCAGAG